MPTPKPQHQPHRLTDLRPNATILCLRCEQPRPMTGALRFRAHWVCAGCAVEPQKVKAKETK